MSELKVDHAAGLFHKTKFSMVIPEVEKLMSSLCNGNVRHIVLFGIEVNNLKQMFLILHQEGSKEWANWPTP